MTGDELREDALGLGGPIAPDEREAVGELQRRVRAQLGVVAQQVGRLVVRLRVEPGRRQHALQLGPRPLGQRPRQRPRRLVVPAGVEVGDSERVLDLGDIRVRLGRLLEQLGGLREAPAPGLHHAEVQVGAGQRRLHAALQLGPRGRRGRFPRFQGRQHERPLAQRGAVTVLRARELSRVQAFLGGGHGPLERRHGAGSRLGRVGQSGAREQQRRSGESQHHASILRRTDAGLPRPVQGLRRDVPFNVATTVASSAGCTGLATWNWKPACSALMRSCAAA